MLTSLPKISSASQAGKVPKVLFVARLLRGYDGISAHLMELGKGLQQEGWEVAIAASFDESSDQVGRGIDWFETNQIQCFPIDFPQFSVSITNGIAASKTMQMLNAAVRHFKPDVIHIHALSVCPFIQVLRLWHRVPVVSTCHMQPQMTRPKVQFGVFLNRYLHFLGDRVIAISSDLKTSFEQVLDVPAEDIRLIYNGINDMHLRPAQPGERSSARAMFEIDDSAQVVCLLGRLNLDKGHNLLFQAIAHLKAKKFPVVAICAGVGPHEPIIREQMQAAGVQDQVRLPGFVEARQVLWASDVLVLPSQKEAFPLVVPEAMLCGVVPIRTPASGASDQIEPGVTGLIVPFDNAVALANALALLLHNTERRIKMAEAARQTACDKFTLSAMVQSTISVYQELIPTYQLQRQL
jgi:glycosyltransferase involved in cell wall biosynthesis